MSWQTYEPLARSMGARYGVPPELVLAVMEIESSFNPRAYRAEPQIGDASRGLMQLLLKTARGLGYTGTPDQLFDPNTNADLGTRLLRDNLRARSYHTGKALSQYNGGYRPSLGFGEPLASTGLFRNQAYVDKGLAAMRKYESLLRPVVVPPAGGGGSTGPGPGSTVPPASRSLTGVWVALGGAAIAAALAYLLKK